MQEWVAIIWRSLVAIIALFIFARLLGKRQITQLTFFEYITGITIGSIAAYIAMETEESWWMGVLSLAVWTIVVLGIEYLTMYSKSARNIIEGRGTVIIKDGKILEDNLMKVRYSADELMAQLRKKNAFKVADVEFAVLETSGELSVLLRKEHQPLTPRMIGLDIGNVPEPQTVIMDGKTLNEPLSTLGLSPAWLKTELEKIGVAIENVFLGQVDGFGQLYVDLYDDQIKVPSPQSLKKLMITLKKCAADLEIFALSTEDEAAKKMYEQCAVEMNDVCKQVQPYLLI